MRTARVMKRFVESEARRNIFVTMLITNGEQDEAVAKCIFEFSKHMFDFHTFSRFFANRDVNRAEKLRDQWYNHIQEWLR